MLFRRTARRTAAVIALAAVGACSDSTAPTIDHIDATAAAAKVAPVMAVMDQPVLASFGSLTTIDGLPASASAAALGAIAGLTNSAARARWDVGAPAMARVAARSADVLPPDVRGKLYTYNEATSQYEGALSSDVPNTSARIVLYAWDPLADRPATPLNPIGHVDLIDESTPTQNRLHVRLVRESDDAVLMDYAITHSATPSSESFSIAGSANNATTTINFDLSGTMSATAGTVTFSLTAPSVGFAVSIDANVDEQAQHATINVGLEYDGHTLTFALSAGENSVSGEISFDGARYATYSITYDPGTGTEVRQFVKANGRPPTALELEQIQSLFERALDFDRFWAGLLWPIGAIATPV